MFCCQSVSQSINQSLNIINIIGVANVADHKHRQSQGVFKVQARGVVERDAGEGGVPRPPLFQVEVVAVVNLLKST